MFAIRMRKNQIITALLTIFAAVILLVTGGGCASVVPPSGGPRDSLPPVIIDVDPPNQSTNFNSKKITISFDEYVELENPFENLVISPLPKLFPEVKRKLRTLEINLKDTLEKNTTYVLNFRNTIKDVNEGNRAKDLLYVFSTGSYLDSLQLSGNVRLARTNKPDSTLTVMLHRNTDDSAVVKERPRYVAKVDSTGTFLFRYLAPGTYRIYAIKSEGGTYQYTSDEQIFAFADEPVVLQGGTQHDPVLLNAYVKSEAQQQQTETEDEGRRLKFTTSLEGDKQDLLQALVLTFAKPLRSFDPAKMQLTTDTIFTPATGYRFTLDSTKKVLTMNMPWQESTRYNLALEKDFATDSLGRQLLKKDTLEFTTKAKAEYGQAKLRFLDLDMNIRPVLLLMQNDQLKYSFPLTTNTLELQLINPGEYEMQMLHDRNRNGMWDPGEFFGEKRQPEIITMIGRKLNVKPNWMTEFEIKMK